MNKRIFYVNSTRFTEAELKWGDWHQTWMLTITDASDGCWRRMDERLHEALALGGRLWDFSRGDDDQPELTNEIYLVTLDQGQDLLAKWYPESDGFSHSEGEVK